MDYPCVCVTNVASTHQYKCRIGRLHAQPGWWLDRTLRCLENNSRRNGQDWKRFCPFFSQSRKFTWLDTCIDRNNIIFSNILCSYSRSQAEAVKAEGVRKERLPYFGGMW